MPLRDRDETQELNDITRKQASGSFIQLSAGYTHYQLSNPEAEETVVLVHGLSVPYFIYDPTFAFLTTCGFRTLRYDLFGRGFSDRPDTPYNMDLFVRQLRELLEALHLDPPVNVVGLSMGGAIAAAFTARHPEQASRLVLIDPVGAAPLALSGLLRIATLPFVGEAAIALVGSGGMVKAIASDFFDRRNVEEFQKRYRDQMQYKGFKRAILSTLRNNMLGTYVEEYRQIGKLEKSVLVFWGRDDTTVPFDHAAILQRAMTQAQLHVLENCGHLPHHERPDEVNPILLKFLRA